MTVSSRAQYTRTHNPTRNSHKHKRSPARKKLKLRSPHDVYTHTDWPSCWSNTDRVWPLSTPSNSKPTREKRTAAALEHTHTHARTHVHNTAHTTNNLNVADLQRQNESVGTRRNLHILVQREGLPPQNDGRRMMERRGWKESMDFTEQSLRSNRTQRTAEL